VGRMKLWGYRTVIKKSVQAVLTAVDCRTYGRDFQESCIWTDVSGGEVETPSNPYAKRSIFSVKDVAHNRNGPTGESARAYPFRHEEHDPM